MPPKRNEESDEYEDEEDDYEDEFQDDEDDETDDEEDLLADPRTKKLYEKIKADAEKAVIEELVKEDTNSPFYKGMQKAMSKKDQELSQYRMALSGLAQQMQTQGGASYEQQSALEVLTEAMGELLDDNGKAVLASRMNQKREANKLTSLEQQIANLTRLAQQGQQGSDPEEDKIREYRKQSTIKLKAMAKKMGVDPEDKNLDYGNEDTDSLFDRMDKLEKSIENASDSNDDDEIRKARRKLTPPQTRDDTGVKRGASSSNGRSLLDQATQGMVEKMRKLNKI